MKGKTVSESLDSLLNDLDKSQKINTKQTNSYPLSKVSPNPPNPKTSDPPKTTQQTTPGRITKTTNELDYLMKDLVDTSKKVRNNENNESLEKLMDELDLTSTRTSETINKPLYQNQPKNIEQNNRRTTKINQPVEEGCCATCRNKISGKIMRALGKQYHPDCFSCSTCQALLEGGNFYDHEDKPQCERCYYSTYSMKCAGCGLPITSQVISAIGLNWHPNCFACTNCKTTFNDKAYFEKDGRPFCSTCFNNVFAPRCKSCNKSISGNCINAMGSQWHPDHFVCQYCRNPFQGGLFYEVYGLPYCDTHYKLHQQRVSRGLPGINTLPPLNTSRN